MFCTGLSFRSSHVRLLSTSISQLNDELEEHDELDDDSSASLDKEEHEEEEERDEDDDDWDEPKISLEILSI